MQMVTYIKDHLHLQELGHTDAILPYSAEENY